MISIFQNREIGDRPNLKPSWTPFVPDLGVKYTRRQMKLQLRGQRWLITRNVSLTMLARIFSAKCRYFILSVKDPEIIGSTFALSVRLGDKEFSKVKSRHE